MEKKNFLQSAVNKVSNITKKTFTNIQKGVNELSEKNAKTRLEKRVKQYNPLFEDEFFGKSFNIPNIIKIVDDAERKGVDVCEGAIGWTAKTKGVEILYLYDEFVAQSGITFVPFAKCDNVYCVDNFDRNRFISVDSIFERSLNEKLAELEHIANCIGAKSISVEIIHTDSSLNKASIGASSKDNKVSENMSYEQSSINKQSGKIVANFDGNENPVRPKLKWFAYDDSISGLVEMRLAKTNSIKSKTLEIACSSVSTMSSNVACAIDAVADLSVSMQKKSSKETNSKLVLEIIF